MRNHSAVMVENLLEYSCCRCLRHAFEHAPNECDAVSDNDGNMLAKCSHRKGFRADCEAVRIQIILIHLTEARKSANVLLGACDL